MWVNAQLPIGCVSVVTAVRVNAALENLSQCVGRILLVTFESNRAKKVSKNKHHEDNMGTSIASYDIHYAVASVTSSSLKLNVDMDLWQPHRTNKEQILSFLP